MNCNIHEDVHARLLNIYMHFMNIASVCTMYLACAVQEYYTVHKYYTSIIMTNSVSKQCIVIHSYD